MEFILECFLFLLPAAIANMAPVVVKSLPIFNWPVDLGFKFRGQRAFGDNKTYRGFIFGVLAAVLTIYLQQKFNLTSQFMLSLAETSNWLFLGFLLGFGALFGDLLKSFFKRQKGIAAGKSWWFFDQVDWIVGAFVFGAFYIDLGWQQFFVSLIMFGVLHLIVNYLGYLLKLKANKF